MEKRLTLMGNGAADGWGAAVSIDGDVTGDGVSDLIVGAAGADVLGIGVSTVGKRLRDVGHIEVISGKAALKKR